MRKHLASRVSLLILKGFFWEGVKRRRRRMEGWRMEGKDGEAGKQGEGQRYWPSKFRPSYMRITSFCTCQYFAGLI